MAKPKSGKGSPSSQIVTVSRVTGAILVLRGQKVVLASDLAQLYGVTVKQLNQAVKRNAERFPEDFMFQLTWEETQNLRSQIVTLPGQTPHARFRPYAFTEHGAVMVASILNSPIAVEASIQVVRAFVQLRELLMTNAAFRRKLEAIERKLEQHDEQFAAVFEAIRQLMTDPDEEDGSRRRSKIGYDTEANRKADARRA